MSPFQDMETNFPNHSLLRCPEVPFPLICKWRLLSAKPSSQLALLLNCHQRQTKMQKNFGFPARMWRFCKRIPCSHKSLSSTTTNCLSFFSSPIRFWDLKFYKKKSDPFNSAQLVITQWFTMGQLNCNFPAIFHKKPSIAHSISPCHSKLLVQCPYLSKITTSPNSPWAVMSL